MTKKEDRHDQHISRVRATGKDGKCTVCSSEISGGVAYFECGAVVDVLDLEKKQLSDDVLEGYCNIGFHGVDPDMKDSADYCVAEDLKGGQISLSFCSLACLRKWFSDIVDCVERQSGPARRI